MKSSIKLLLVTAFVMLATDTQARQKRYLVSPYGELSPLSKEQSAIQEVRKRARLHQTAGTTVGCTGFTFGYPLELYPSNTNFVGHHKDVLGQWFVAKATGTIDTLFWFGGEVNTALDSTVRVRIHNSIIGPDFGPGIRPGPYNPPCQNWGYWTNTNDLDQGVAAFIEEATDTTWTSTINHSPEPSRAPFANEIWGLGGFPTTFHVNSINHVAMMDLGTPCTVKTGQKIFVSMRVNGPNEHVPGDEGLLVGVYWAASGFSVANVSDENYPARAWKFYEHDSGPSNCAGMPTALVKRGWVARGGYSDDTLDVSAYNWWYVMTVASNVPPTLRMTPEGDLHGTIVSTADQHLMYDIADCDPEKPDSAGLASVLVKWATAKDQLNPVYVSQPDIPMTNTGGSIWEADIPGQPGGTAISYHVVATDLVGAVTSGPSQSYRVFTLDSPYYLVDTNTACVQYDIRSTGSTIDTSRFFVPPYAGHGTGRQDDGTAGPFDLGGPMPIFGDTARYVWIGVNGGIALSKKATDTLDVNANGLYAGSSGVWSFPNASKGPRPDSARTNNMPGNFIAPLWADLIIADSTGTFGRIVTQQEPCLFTVEWDSVGAYAETGSLPDNTTFRVILNKCDGTIEFQYSSLGVLGQDSTCVVGLQADSNAVTRSNSMAVFIHSYLQPYETKPRENWCIKFYPGAAAYANAGWNMLSVGTMPQDYRKAEVYPLAASSAFAFQGGYVVVDPLANGPGYWLKFNDYSYAGAPGRVLDSLEFSVNKGWNMIGSTSHTVAVSSIQKKPPGMNTASYFGYGGSGYTIINTIKPGFGYWVKTDSTGTLKLPPPSAAVPQAYPKADVQVSDFSQLNTVTIIARDGRSQTLFLDDQSLVKQSQDAFQMPPAAPEFDARFSSGRLVETYPTALDPKANYEYPITIQSSAYPLTVRWNVVHASQRKLVMRDGIKQLAVMEGRGSVRIGNSAVKRVTVALGGEAAVPKVFALSQNYPNPFNPTTRFMVDVPRTTKVEVAVFDLLGQRLASLMTGEVNAGSYRVTWDGRDSRGLTVPTGIYFVRMSADEFSAVRKIVMMK